MKRAAMFVVLLLLIGISGFAEPILMTDQHTAWIGEDNYLYLQDIEGNTKVLPTGIRDIVDLKENELICLADNGKLYCVQLDGSRTTTISSDPLQEEINALRAKHGFTLENGILIWKQQNLSTKAIMAAEYTDHCYWIEQASQLTWTVRANRQDADTPLFVIYEKPVAFRASPDMLAVLGEKGSLYIYDLQANTMKNAFVTDEKNKDAVAFNHRLYLYAVDENGYFSMTKTVETDGDLGILAQNTESEKGFQWISDGTALKISASPEPTATISPTATVKPKATAAPAKTTKPTAEPEERTKYDRINYGEHNSFVRKMQQRLKNLGYPIESVDGSFGINTKLALNLFQFMAGYTERNYASTSVLKKLYASSAPLYDPCVPLEYGNSGAAVKVMQENLITLGYPVGEKLADGKYGEDTAEAVKNFQKDHGFEITGNANRETLLKMVELIEYPWITPTPSPTTVPTEVPTSVPTVVPTEVPTEAPTEVPTEAPTEVPTEEPTEVPAEAPTEASTEVPAETPTPTEAPTEAPPEVQTETSTEKPTGVPPEESKEEQNAEGTPMEVSSGDESTEHNPE